MKPKWQKLASLAQEICTLCFGSLVQSLLPKDTLLRTYYKSVKRQKITMFQSNAFCSMCIDEYILILGPYLIINSKILVLKH